MSNPEPPKLSGIRVPVEIANLAVKALEDRVATLEAQKAALAADLVKARANNLVTYTISDTYPEEIEEKEPKALKSDRVIKEYVLTLPSGRDLRLNGDTTAPEIATEVLSLIAHYTASANRPSK